MEAYAAEAGAAATQHAFYEEPTFWVLIAFVIFFALVGKKVFGAINSGLDARAEKIRTQIDEATRLREEAQEMLATYERKQHEAKKEAENIVERARKEADRLGKKAEADLEASISRREQQAEERIQQAEAKAMQQVRAKAVDLAISATEKLLAKQLSADKADKLVNEAIKTVGGKLH